MADAGKTNAPSVPKADPRATPAVATPQYTIGSGDVLNIQVWKEKDLRASGIWMNYKSLIQGSDTNHNLQLNPGDTVVIP
ncbi:hypothetical protein AB4043_03010 [Terriglobus sp. YAF25]|uniref:hypothetical protein n=1 Tax=Terriglobus sp. YAF25 TaxID=3233080 RepID=UPI003F9629DC